MIYVKKFLRKHWTILDLWSGFMSYLIAVATFYLNLFQNIIILVFFLYV